MVKPARIKKPRSNPMDVVTEEAKEAIEIPKNLPPIVRSVAESLLLRDPQSARRYLQLHTARRDT